MPRRSIICTSDLVSDRVARYLFGMNAPTDKFRRYRAKKKAQGLREVRLWVPDLRNPEVRARILAEGAALRDTPGEKEAIEWLDAAVEENWKDLD